MLSVIIAAGALFTAVYDVLYKYTTTNTTILNAETVDNTGKVFFGVEGTTKSEAGERFNLNFDNGTWMVVFSGQSGLENRMMFGHGATCFAFYKGNNMTVQVGVDSLGNSGGKTIVTTNFAHPVGYSGALEAIAAGGGYGSYGYYTSCGMFKGMEYSSSDWIIQNDTVDMGNLVTGEPGSWTHSGSRYNHGISREGYRKGGYGGAGYYNGGGGYSSTETEYYLALGGGGSSTPWCYPLYTWDMYTRRPWQGSDIYSGHPCRLGYDLGTVWFYRIDPLYLPTVGSTVVYGSKATVTPAKTINGNRYDPQGAVHETLYGADETYDCGIRAGWVYSCSEDGEKWGAGSERKCRRHLKFNTARCYNEWSKA